MIEYPLKDEEGQSSEEIYRLITSILDPDQAEATELAALYPQRREVEVAIKETKAILRKGSITLRSKLPDLVRQEFWGMLLAHYLVRKMMADAALDGGVNPDKLSYQGCLEIIKRKIPCESRPFSPRE